MNRADVGLKAKEAVVAFDPAQVTVQQMIAAVDRLGFRATTYASSAANAPYSSVSR